MAHDVARDITASITGNGDSSPPTGTGPRRHDDAGRDGHGAGMDFAEANQWASYGMAIAVGIGFLGALRHPGGPAVLSEGPAESRPFADSPGRRTDA